MSKFVLDRVLEKFSDAVISHHANCGDETILVQPARLVEICRFLKDDPSLSFEMLMDLTGVDLLGLKPAAGRFEVVYHLYSLSKAHRIRLKVELPEQDPKVATVVPLWKSALWMEREAYDLYGIGFPGHPDLRRILLYPEFEGYPLRKDYPMEQRQPLIPPRAGREHL